MAPFAIPSLIVVNEVRGLRGLGLHEDEPPSQAAPQDPLDICLIQVCQHITREHDVPLRPWKVGWEYPRLDLDSTMFTGPEPRMSGWLTPAKSKLGAMVLEEPEVWPSPTAHLED